MNRVRIIIVILSLTSIMVSGQDTEKEEFVPNGRPVALVFTNFHATFSNTSPSYAFEVTRAYLGYEYNFSPKFYAKVNIDVGDPGVGKLQMTAFLKNAYLRFKTKRFTITGGMIGLYQFRVQEKHWENRYLLKSFQDAYKFGPSADIGIVAQYQLLKNLEIDASILNGEGYKLIQSDSTLKYSIGTTYNPGKFVFRAYYDYMKTKVAQQTVALFAGFKGERFSVGGEYNLQIDHNLIDNHNFDGVSFYGNYHFKNKMKVYARYDRLASEKVGTEPSPWNFDKDGSLYLIGFEFSPLKGVRISPNFRGWGPLDSSESFRSSIFLSAEYKF